STSRHPAMYNHGQYAGFSLFSAPSLSWRWVDNVCDGCALENFCRGIANVKKNLVERPVLRVAINQAAQLIGIAEWRQLPVNQADDLPEMNLRRRPAQLISALGPPRAFHHADVVKFGQDQLE